MSNYIDAVGQAYKEIQERMTPAQKDAKEKSREGGREHGGTADKPGSSDKFKRNYHKSQRGVSGKGDNRNTMNIWQKQPKTAMQGNKPKGKLPEENDVNESKFIIPEEIPANERTAFHGAAAAAAKAGKKSFSFNGKTHPVTMAKDTAHKIADDTQKEGAMDFSKDAYKRAAKKPEAKLIVKGKPRAANNPFRARPKMNTYKVEGVYKDMDTEKGEPSPRSDKKVTADFKKRRKMKKDEKSDVEMNPKMGDSKAEKGAPMETKESTIREKLMAVLEGDRAKHYKGATKPETMDDKLKGKGAKDMVNQPKEVDDTEEKGHKDSVKAGKTGPTAKARSGGDNTRNGDQKIIPSATPVKGAMYKTMEAYTSMYEQSVTTTHDVTGDKDDKKGVINYVKKTAGGNVTVKHHGMTPNGDHEISVTGHPKHVMKFVNKHEDEKYSHDKAGHDKYKKDFG